MSRFDFITFCCLVCMLPVYAIREAWAGMARERTISMVARFVGWWFSSFVFFWSSMAIHWWVPSPFPDSVVRTVAFWAIVGVLLVWDFIWWRSRWPLPTEWWPRWARWLRWPVWYVIAGPLGAYFLFPQGQVIP